MDENPASNLEERILLLAPTRRDAIAATNVFDSAGITLIPCKDFSELLLEIDRGAGVAIVPDEAILNDREGRLVRLLKAQPPWADFPLIVLTPPLQTRAAAHALESIGHMTLVPRPVNLSSLASTIQAALRDRRHQYAKREDLAIRERQAQALRDNDRRKDEFLAMLAHELRNPLAAVNSALDVLKLTNDEESRHWASDVIERQVGQLVRLIDDLLDVSRINSGKIRLQRQLIEATTSLEHAVESARPLIEERRHTLFVSIDRGNLPLYADATRVEQIVLNLLTNAAKYTDRGGRILLTGMQEGENVVIRVKDNGIGIPAEKLPEMFQLFAQGDRTLARSEGGLGVGLTIVKKLAEMHGGSVEARSEPGQGSEFLVSLPLARKTAEEETKVPSVPRAERRVSRILVVDDNVDTALAITRLLKLRGHDVIAVHDGPAAIAAAHSFCPDFVVLDIGLPGKDGYEVASILREDALLKDMVIIALSGYGQDEDRRRSQAAGFHHHLVKPVDFDSLLSLIEQSGSSLSPPSRNVLLSS